MKARTGLLVPFRGLALRHERWEFAERVMGAVRLGLVLALVVPSAGCIDLGPSTPTQRFDLQGIITSASDGLPVEGSKVFLTLPCPALSICVSYSGSPPPYDTVVTDAMGRYHLGLRSGG